MQCKSYCVALWQDLRSPQVAVPVLEATEEPGATLEQAQVFSGAWKLSIGMPSSWF